MQIKGKQLHKNESILHKIIWQKVLFFRSVSVYNSYIVYR